MGSGFLFRLQGCWVYVTSNIQYAKQWNIYARKRGRILRLASTRNDVEYCCWNSQSWNDLFFFFFASKRKKIKTKKLMQINHKKKKTIYNNVLCHLEYYSVEYFDWWEKGNYEMNKILDTKKKKEKKNSNDEMLLWSEHKKKMLHMDRALSSMKNLNEKESKANFVLVLWSLSVHCSELIHYRICFAYNFFRLFLKIFFLLDFITFTYHNTDGLTIDGDALTAIS